jgi:hypothetical protein
MPPPRPPTPFAGVSDLSIELPPEWQMVDGVIRQVKLAIRAPGMQKIAKAVAVLSSVLETLNKLFSHYTQKGDGGGAPTSIVTDTERGGEPDEYLSTDVGDAPTGNDG